jgi:hypothetical protein
VWQWDINTLLAQPDEWLDLVFSLKSIGENYRDQMRNQKRDDHSQ